MLKIILLVVLAIIFFQDFKTRMVFWLLYPLVGIIGFLLQLNQLGLPLVLAHSFLNVSFVLILVAILYLYSKVRFKVSFFKEVFGMGDLMFFIFICFSFPTLSFLILFVFSLLFSLVMHFVLKHKTEDQTVPLAGYMALFFGIVYTFTFIENSNYLYAY